MFKLNPEAFSSTRFILRVTNRYCTPLCIVNFKSNYTNSPLFPFHFHITWKNRQKVRIFIPLQKNFTCQINLIFFSTAQKSKNTKKSFYQLLNKQFFGCLLLRSQIYVRNTVSPKKQIRTQKKAPTRAKIFRRFCLICR